jgi:hypothetical protein
MGRGFSTGEVMDMSSSLKDVRSLKSGSKQTSPTRAAVDASEVKKWNDLLESEGLGEIKGLYVSSRSFWQLDINRRKRYSS